MKKFREPSSIIEMVELCRISNRRVADSKTIDGKERKVALAVLHALSLADFYELDDGIAKTTDMMFETQFAGKRTDDTTLDLDCRLPSKVCTFWTKGTSVEFAAYEEEFPCMYLAVEEEKLHTHVYLISPYFGSLYQGSYVPEEEGGLYGPEDGDEEDKMTRAMHVLTVASVCSILNQPSFTKSGPVGSRQERRAAQRSGGYATDAWHKITWNIGEEVKNKLTRDDPVRCMPLHYTRGHWRRGQEGWTNTTQRKDGLWYQWIEGYWSGHPAFGVKKSYHAPKLGDAA